MQAGTQILIDRMKSHPEEFVEGAICRWATHISYAMEWLPEEDKAALRTAINERRMDEFNERVFKELAGETEKEPEEETITFKTKGRYAVGWTDPRAMMLDDHLDAHRTITSGIREWMKGQEKC